MTAVSTGEEEERGDCAICLSAKAIWVFEKCGHRCICKACARKQKEKMLGLSPKKGKKKGSTPLVNCPLCRAETRVVRSQCFEGTTFGA